MANPKFVSSFAQTNSSNETATGDSLDPNAYENGRNDAQTADNGVHSGDVSANVVVVIHL